MANGWHSSNVGGGTSLDDPALSSSGPNKLDIFVRGLDGNLWQMWTTGIGWNGWQQLSVLSLGSGPSAVSLWGSTRVDIVSRMVDGTIGHWWYG